MGDGRYIQYAGIPLIDDPEQFYSALPALNTYTLDSGVEPSGGQFLCSENNLASIKAAIASTGYGDLVFDSGRADENAITINKVALLRADSAWEHLTPVGERSAQLYSDLYVITLADHTRLAATQSPGTANTQHENHYPQDPGEGATTATWANLFDALGAACGLGSLGTSLPYTPSAEPHDSGLPYGANPKDLLQAYICRCFLRLIVNKAGAASLVRRSDSNSIHTQSLNGLIAERYHLAGGIIHVGPAAVPASLRICFPLYNKDASHSAAGDGETLQEMREGIAGDTDGDDAFYTVTKSAPTISPASGTITPMGGALSVYLHYYAVYEAAAYTNAATLATIATEIQTEYYKRYQHDHFRYVFAGIHDYEPDKLIKSA